MTTTYTDIDCVICFSDKYTYKNVNLDFSLYTTKCGHKFHRKCLKTWCHTSNSCPNCRTLDVMLISSSRNSNPTTNNYHYSNTYVISEESSDDTSHTEGYPADFNNSPTYYQSPSNLRPNIIQYNIDDALRNINLNNNNIDRLPYIRPPIRRHNRIAPHSNIINHIWNDNRYSADQQTEVSESDEDTTDTINTFNDFNNRNYRNNFPSRNHNLYNQTTVYDVAQELYQNASRNYLD